MGAEPLNPSVATSMQDAEVSTSDDRTRMLPVTFTGSAGEYFRIWIVNLALSVVTLGIYSAWATVRTQRYFYNNTSIDGAHFDFHGKPVSILIGRIISVALLGAYFLSGYLHELLPLVVLLVIFAAVPWLVVRSRIFRMRNSSFRGMRFDFAPNYSGAFHAYYVGALVTLISLGFATPTGIYWRNRFAVDNSAFGETPFRLGCSASPFYGIFWATIGLGFLGFFGLIIALIPLGMLSAPAESETSSGVVADVVIPIVFFLFYLSLFVYSTVRTRNLIWNSATIRNSGFESTLSVRAMIVIYITNAVAIIATIGLLTPWAKVRLARYRAEHLEVRLRDDWDDFPGSKLPPGSAAGDEIGEAFDIGVEIGF